MSLRHLVLCAVAVYAFEVPLRPVMSSYRFTLWNAEPLSLTRSELTEVQPDPIQNVQYIANLSIGHPPQEVSFIVTTSSPWMIVSTPECKDCFSDKGFDTAKSDSFKGSKRRIILDEFEASLGEDNVSLPQGPTLLHQKLLLVHKSPYLSNIQAEGVLGLAYNKLLWDDMGLLENLKRQKLIDKMVFAVHLYSNFLSNSTEDVMDSAISFGSWNLAQYARGEFSYMRLASEPGQWKVLLTSAKFGTIELVDGFNTASIELGASLLIVPHDVYLQIEFAICSDHVCLYSESLLSFKCDAIPQGMQNFKLIMDQTEVVITPEMYMQVDNGKCQLLMTSYYSNSWIIGTMILKRYYVIFDMEEHRIGLAPSVNIPTPGPWWILWTFLILLALGAAATGGYLHHKAKAHKKHAGDAYQTMGD